MQSTIDTPGRIIARLAAALAFGVGGVATAHPGIDPAQAASPEAFLKDAWYDEFVLRGQIVAPPGAMGFKVVQACEKGQWAWSEVPASATSTKGLKAPAALLEILPADGESRH